MSNPTALQTLATKILTESYGYEQARLINTDPKVLKLRVCYTYTREFGSDGCWDKTEEGVCTFGTWICGIGKQHPGNRCYDFRIKSIG